MYPRYGERQNKIFTIFFPFLGFLKEENEKGKLLHQMCWTSGEEEGTELNQI